MSSKLLHHYNFLQTESKNVIDQFEFCRFHKAEQIVIPEGIKKGYPTSIDFTKLPERIHLRKNYTISVKRKAKAIIVIL